MTGRMRLAWWTLWPLTVVIGLAAELFQATYRGRDAAWLAADLVSGWVFVAAGLAAMDRRPTNRIGPFAVAVGLTWFIGGFAAVPNDRISWLATGLQGWFEPLLAILILAYPSGRLGSPVARAIGLAWLIDLAGWSAARLILERPLSLYDCVTCPGTVDAYIGARELLDRVGPVSLAFASALALATLVIVAARLVRASPPARRRLAPVAVGGAALVLGLSLSGAARVSGLAPQVIDGDGGFVLVAILRVLVAVGILGGLIDRRLARSAVADLVVDLSVLPAPRHLRAALAGALGDPSLDVLLFDQASDAYRDDTGHEVRPPTDDATRAVTVLERDGRPLAAIVHDPAIRDEPGLVAAVGAAVRLAVDNQRLQTELEARLTEVEASRARIVAAGDAERLRVERDLHDGAQQRLVGLSFALRRATARAVSGDDAALQATLREAQTELDGAIDELRELARGIHPSILTDVGLGPALGSLAARADLPVTVETDLGERLPAGVEATAYFVAAEALTNVSRYARATNATIRTKHTPGELRIEVIDDGVGGAHPSAGSGLRGLADRVAAAGGTFALDSPIGGGTRIVATIPC
jgi:signal transduction histidine kinase